MKYGIFPCLLSGLLLCACTSAPISYYTMLTDTVDDQSSDRHVSFALDVLPVGVPEQLDHSQLVIREGRSEVVILDSKRWTASLGEEIRVALSDRLTRHWHTIDASGLSDSGAERLLRIKLQLRRLDIWPNDQIVLQADWSMGFADTPETQLNCRSQLEQPLHGGYESVAEGMQQLIARLATDISVSLEASRPMQCAQPAGE